MTDGAAVLIISSERAVRRLYAGGLLKSCRLRMSFVILSRVFINLGGRLDSTRLDFPMSSMHTQIHSWFVVVGWYVFIAFRTETLFRTIRNAIFCTHLSLSFSFFFLVFLTLHLFFLKGVICCYMQRPVCPSTNTSGKRPFLVVCATLTAANSITT
ncbi:hypothetical protein V8C42DRAFT_244979 [Trichoderma barbatum]